MHAVIISLRYCNLEGRLSCIVFPVELTGARLFVWLCVVILNLDVFLNRRETPALVESDGNGHITIDRLREGDHACIHILAGKQSN